MSEELPNPRAGMRTREAHDSNPPGAGECHLWWWRLADVRPWLPDLIGMLSSQELESVRSLRRSVDRDRSIASRALLRITLAGYLERSPRELTIVRSCGRCGQPHGKPRLLSPPADAIQFSVAHAADRLVMAFTIDDAVGVDVEEASKDFPVEEIAPEVLTPVELTAFSTLPPDARRTAFFVSWTRKEAVVKATGHGLAVPLRSFEVSAAHEPASLRSWPPDPRLDGQVCLRDLDAGSGYAAALATIGRPCDHLSVRDGRMLLG
ncbi:MAG: 4'-phosphopantetheinyl transferase family protein, partial [Actinomycetota bacterium]